MASTDAKTVSKSIRRQMIDSTTTNKPDTNNNNNNQEEEDDDEWQPINVESDMKLLNIAVLKSRAEDDYQEQVLLSKLKAFARGRHEIKTDVKKYVTLMMTGILSFYGAHYWLAFSDASDVYQQQSYLSKMILSYCQRFLLKIFIHIMAIQFWFFVVLSPLLQFIRLTLSTIRQRKEMKKIESSSDSDSNHDKETMMMWTESKQQNSKSWKENDNYLPFFLFGYWLPSTTSFMIYYLLLIKTKKTLPSIMDTILFNQSLMMITIQLLTRISASLSIHQHPEMTYELSRNDYQSLPLTKNYQVIKSNIKFMIRCLPYGLSSDIGKFIFQLQ